MADDDWIEVSAERIPEIARTLAREQRQRMAERLDADLPEIDAVNRKRLLDQGEEIAQRVYERDLEAGFAQHLMREGRLN